MDRATVEKRLKYWQDQVGELMDAYTALIKGKVKSYTIDDRTLTKFDIASLKRAINDAEAKVDEYEALLNGMAPRRAFGVLPRDW
jgi:aminoglycoside phosphotransferase family enzyme